MTSLSLLLRPSVCWFVNQSQAHTFGPYIIAIKKISVLSFCSTTCRNLVWFGPPFKRHKQNFYIGRYGLERRLSSTEKNVVWAFGAFVWNKTENGNGSTRHQSTGEFRHLFFFIEASSFFFGLSTKQMPHLAGPLCKVTLV